ncbi:unnamed protein product [marine sediment metagenome]|uniref:Uncharacterized protein n=1 Tax=marine sediment metagenome TaxID=412755 RepID=X1KUU6_9ZZZZ
MFDFFKKKPPIKDPQGLEKAKELGLITEEEFLKLEIWRSEKKLKDLGSSGEKKSHHRRDRERY